jgi:hypothetical protein
MARRNAELQHGAVNRVTIKTPAYLLTFSATSILLGFIAVAVGYPPASLRVQVFLGGAVLGRAGCCTVLHLSSAWGGLEKRNPLFDKLLHDENPTSRKLDFRPRPAG